MGLINVLFFSQIPVSVCALHNFFSNDDRIKLSVMPFGELLSLAGRNIDNNTIVIVEDNSLYSDEQVAADNFFINKDTRVKKIIFTSRLNLHYLGMLIYEGIDGIVTARSGWNKIRDAIYTVAEGKRYIDSAVKKSYTEHERETTAGNSPKLTKRETEIVILLGKGKSNKEIAGELFIDPKTVETHESNVMKKFNIKKIKDLAILAALELLNIGMLFIALISKESP